MVRTLPLALSRLRRPLQEETILLVAWLLLFLAAEVGLRFSGSDVVDGLGVAGLLVLALVTWRQHQRSPLQLLLSIEERVRRVIGNLEVLQIESGVDLRGEPPLPRGFPRAFGLLLVASVGASVLLFVARDLFPTVLRSTLTQVSSAAYLLYLSTIWAVLAGGAFVLFVLPIAFLDDALDHSIRIRGEKRVLIEAALIGMHVLILVLGAIFAPAWVPLALVVGTLILTGLFAFLPGCPQLRIVWRSPRRSKPAVMDWTALAFTNLVVLGAAVVVVTLLGRGDRLGGVEALPAAAETTAVTALLGLIFSWTASMAYCVLMLGIPLTVFSGRFRDPSRPRPTRVRLDGADDTRRAKVSELLSGAGLRLLGRRARPRPTDVPLRFTQEGGPAPVRWQSSWPLVVGEDELESPDLVERVARRDEILRRRHLFRGLRKLFKAAARRKHDEGTGYWLAPHHWFVTRMGRDVDAEDAWFSGPSYHPVIPLESRAHFADVMAACELDIVFVEDGVGFRRLRRVLALLFEYHDIFGEGRRVEENHFSGIPGARVLIHEYSLGQEYPYKHYPEPDYEDLGRARILHVFRDRGEEEETVDDPVTPDHVPEPVLMG